MTSRREWSRDRGDRKEMQVKERKDPSRGRGKRALEACKLETKEWPTIF
jgi:hypothetical protein